MYSVQAQREASSSTRCHKDISCFTKRMSDNLITFICDKVESLVANALVPGASSLSWSSSQGHCVVFLGKILNSHSASLYPGV